MFKEPEVLWINVEYKGVRFRYKEHTDGNYYVATNGSITQSGANLHELIKDFGDYLSDLYSRMRGK